jgi:hypothetical protein
MLISFKQDPINKYVKELQKIKSTKFPAAVKMTLNTAAYNTQVTARTKTIVNKFVLRNEFTKRGIVYTKVASNSIQQMVAYTGADSGGVDKKVEGTKKRDYMLKQEVGGETQGKKKYLFIPTNQSRVSQQSSNIVSSRFRLSNTLDKAFTKQGKTFVITTKTGQKLLCIRSPKKSIRVIRVMTDKTIKIKSRHWLKDSIISSRDMDNIFFDMAKKIISEHQQTIQ